MNPKGNDLDLKMGLGGGVPGQRTNTVQLRR